MILMDNMVLIFILSVTCQSPVYHVPGFRARAENTAASERSGLLLWGSFALFCLIKGS